MKVNVKEFLDIKNKFEQELIASGEKILTEVFQTIFDKHPGLNRALLIGYTPEWNDGEECIHNSIVLVCHLSSWYSDYHGGQFWCLDIDDYGTVDDERVKEFFGLEFDNYYETTSDREKFFSMYSKTYNANCPTLSEAITDLLGIDNIIQMVYRTNYEIFISRDENGVVSFTKEHYDCGH